jgi:hypothetical protein
MPLAMPIDGGRYTPSPARNVDAPLTGWGDDVPPLCRNVNAQLTDALAALNEKSHVKPDTAGDLGIDHISEAEQGVRSATSDLVNAATNRVLDYYHSVTGKTVTVNNIDQAVADTKNFAIAQQDVLDDYQGNDAKDVAAALNTLKIQAAVDKAEADAPSQNAAAVAGLAQIVQGLRGQDPRAVAIEGLSAPVQKVLAQVVQMSPYQAHDPATAAQRSQAEQGLLALADELAPADNAARTESNPRTSTQAALNGVENDLIGIDRTIEPTNDNSSVVEQFWDKYEQQVGATNDAAVLF